MRFYDLIEKKKSGEALEASEIKEAVNLYTAGGIPDYQMSAFLMAVCLRGMTGEETVALTEAIRDSGDVVNLMEFGDGIVDKHSTGGVGDKTTLIISPIVAAAGGVIAKMSGRGLGHTGGTVDKLEAIPGFATTLSPEKFKKQVEEIGIAVVGQSGELAPADKKLYALRDVTATVDSIPLIASSIMGKKLAAGAKSIVLDVKYGNGAFMKSQKDAEALADAMMEIGKKSGRRMAAVISSMNAPLGYAVGNLCEAKEAEEILSGKSGGELLKLCLTLAALMLSLSLNIDLAEAEIKARGVLSDGSALAKFRQWLTWQGVRPDVANAVSSLPMSNFFEVVISPCDGYVSSIDAKLIGSAAMTLGAGRAEKNDSIDHGAGIILAVKRGDKVRRGDILATLYSSKKELLCAADTCLCAFVISESQCDTEPVVYKIIT